MFDEIERMQQYYLQLRQAADCLMQQAYQLRSQAEECLQPMHHYTQADALLDSADDTYRQMMLLSNKIHHQAEEVQKALEQLTILIPPAPPPALNI